MFEQEHSTIYSNKIHQSGNSIAILYSGSNKTDVYFYAYGQCKLDRCIFSSKWKRKVAIGGVEIILIKLHVH